MKNKNRFLLMLQLHSCLSLVLIVIESVSLASHASLI